MPSVKFGIPVLYGGGNSECLMFDDHTTLNNLITVLSKGLSTHP